MKFENLREMQAGQRVVFLLISMSFLTLFFQIRQSRVFSYCGWFSAIPQRRWLASVRQFCTALAIEQHCSKHIGFFHSLSVLQEDLYLCVCYIVHEPAEKPIVQDHVFYKLLRKQNLICHNALADQRQLADYLGIPDNPFNPSRVAVKGNTIVCLTCSRSLR